MAKNLKLNIKNKQLSDALQLDKLKKQKAEETLRPRKAAAPKKPVEPEILEEVQAPVSEEKVEVVVQEEIAPVETPPAPPEVVETAPPPIKGRDEPFTPTKARQIVDDFRKPKIIRKTAPPPPPPRPAPAPAATTAPAESKPKTAEEISAEEAKKKAGEKKPAFFKDYRELRAQKKVPGKPSFDTRDKSGLGQGDERWRKRRPSKRMSAERKEELTIRPKTLSIRLPMTVKELANELKVKSSELIQKLFMQGIAITINDILDDQTTVQLLGHEFGCEISIDTTEAERIKITAETIREEIAASDPKDLVLRPPVITFMGHVDHGKTSLIDTIRKSNIAGGEAGAITQHIGAFKCHTEVGEITILDTPGHEAFYAMRERGAEVTDLVVLVIAGDEGMREQTVEAMNKAKEAKVPILVAINKCDKPNFDPETVYRQLSEHDLLPEAWGGTTITVNCSATTGAGIKQLLEMLALQSEVLELKSNPSSRARGSVIESEMHKGMGAVATVLVQNGTLRLGDPLVFDQSYARVKTMHDEFGKELSVAGPSTPVKITGLSHLPEAGSEFIAVESDKEAKEIAKVRREEVRHLLHQKKKRVLESFLEKRADVAEKKVLHLLIRADVQGSLEAIKHALQKIKSEKAELNIVSEEVGHISESDIQLAAASGATIVGFHTKVEAHAEPLVKQTKVKILLHDIIYHLVDDIKDRLRALLDKIPTENEMGSAEVRATFRSSHVGIIAGCTVLEGLIKRNHHARLKRKGELLWTGTIGSLKRVKEDVKEVGKGIECGIVLNGFNQCAVGDIIETYEITYLEQEL